MRKNLIVWIPWGIVLLVLCLVADRAYLDFRQVQAQTFPPRATLTGTAVTVTTAGTKVAVTPNVETRAYWVLIQVKAANTGAITVKTSNDTAITLQAPVAGDTLPFYTLTSASNFLDLSKVWVDAAVSGEGVNVHYLQTTGNPW